MIFYKNLKEYKPNIIGNRNKFDNNVYTFDIETTSYFILDGKVHPAIEYDNLIKEDKERCTFQSTMYIWMLGINTDIYYGRTWQELHEFISVIDELVPEKKYFFVHNLSFEFQFLRNIFLFKNVLARKSRHVMTFELVDFNIEFRCTYFMSNVALKKLPSMYNLPVEKLLGDLDYTLLRHSKSVLTETEFGYCKNDCLVIYYYILEELKQYETVKRIPITSTGHVRRELMELVMKNFKYRKKLSSSISDNPIIYNRLVECYQGGFTHANYYFASEIISDVDSFDFCSSYPFCMVAYKYPMGEFRSVRLKKREQMLKGFAYLLVVKFNNIRCKYYNTFISKSKCRGIRGGKYDNGRVIKASELEITLTDVDFKLILDTYEFFDGGSYEIIESYISKYDYLPKEFINFILDKYVIKTEFKGIKEKELEYVIEKGKFNSLYGMTVTNNIRDEVVFDNINGWCETPITNDEIIEKLKGEKKKGFMNFSTGCWVTAWARNNLIRNIIAKSDDGKKCNDDFCIYVDTDSMKLRAGYDINIINKYNENVLKRLNYVSNILGIKIDRFKPKDKNGVEHPLGVFENDGSYVRFVSQGSKKYCVEEYVKNDKIDENVKVLKHGENESLCLAITVAGVPKKGVAGLSKIEDFKDNFIFNYEYTGKNIIVYNKEKMDEVEITDYNGIKYKVSDKWGSCLLPTTYELGKAMDYANLIEETSSQRSLYTIAEGEKGNGYKI